MASLRSPNKFANVARRKLGTDWSEVRAAVDSIRTVCRVIAPLDVETDLDGLRRAERYRFSFSDSPMIASAPRLDATCFTEGTCTPA